MSDSIDLKRLKKRIDQRQVWFGLIAFTRMFREERYIQMRKALDNHGIDPDSCISSYFLIGGGIVCHLVCPDKRVYIVSYPEENRESCATSEGHIPQVHFDGLDVEELSELDPEGPDECAVLARRIFDRGKRARLEKMIDSDLSELEMRSGRLVNRWDKLVSAKKRNRGY